MMTVDEFQMLADTWGADISRWPENVRAAAARFADTDEAKAILAAARRFDELILLARPQVSDERAGGVIFAVATTISARTIAARTILARSRITLGRVSSLSWWSVSMVSVASAALIGMWLGVVRPLHLFRDSPHSAVVTMILDEGPIDLGWVLR